MKTRYLFAAGLAFCPLLASAQDRISQIKIDVSYPENSLPITEIVFALSRSAGDKSELKVVKAGSVIEKQTKSGSESAILNETKTIAALNFKTNTKMRSVCLVGITADNDIVVI